uniref:Uncharacterized protein n=1 Tax=Tetraselmis chuii TaxID=63592 RepID=A0A7S1X9G1_9CHLO|mmetsp:Transcript_42311/g.75938  ORF Transcript_42311/g.75938 Transcript_42311/m.75938 type:complete len:154 (+) Transcript_42311:121-582(+)
MIDALRHSPNPVYFASSKSGALVSRILRDNLGLDVPDDSPRVFAGLLPPNQAKAAALRDIAARPVCQTPGAKLHFIDDRFETLQAMSAGVEGGVAPWKLYLAAWGYNTEEERQAARANGITVLSLEQCCELIKWGVVMGVDDGCEPEADEITR